LLKIRLLSSFVGLGLLAFALIGPSQVFYFGVLLITVIGLNEFFNVMKISSTSFKIIGFAATLPFLFFYNYSDVVAFTIYIVVLSAFTIVILDYEKKTVQDILISIVGTIFVTFLFSHLIKVYNLPQGKILIWIVFLGAFATDTFAYFIGSNFGKHKLTPISPKKSIEGAIGGLIGSIIIVLIFGYIATAKLGLTYPIYNYIVLGLITGTISQIGDLSASIFKRYAKVKDYGALIPGHGGVLDRFDSVLFIAPAVYYYLLYFLF
jgi:phosphatidate cytidylyltransferase